MLEKKALKWTGMAGSYNHNYAWNLTTYRKVNIPYSPLDSDYPQFTLKMLEAIAGVAATAVPENRMLLPPGPCWKEFSLPMLFYITNPSLDHTPGHMIGAGNLGKTNDHIFLIPIAGHRLYFPPGALGQVIFQLYNWMR